MKLKNILVKLIINIISMPLVIIYYFKPSQKELNSIIQKVDAIFFIDGKPRNILPKSLVSKFNTIVYIDKKKEYFNKVDRKFFYRLIQYYPFSYFFLLKSIIKIRYYSYVIRYYRPDYIIVCAEYSFTSSLLTSFCEERNIKHINVMHGEKLYFMRDSFFRFHMCFIWDKFYENLFCSLRADNKQFKIEIPQSLNFNNSVLNKPKIFDFTYYLGLHNYDVLEMIIKNMKYISDHGYKVIIRPHPRYTEKKEIVKISYTIDVEDIRKISVVESLKRTKNAISIYSTVLYQAYNNGINVVIDDISDINTYTKLFDLRYIMLSKSYQKLSEIKNNIGYL